MLKVFSKILKADFRKNYVSYIVLLCSILLCTVSSVLYFKEIRVGVSTPYDERYEFAWDTIDNYDKAYDLLKEYGTTSSKQEVLHLGIIMVNYDVNDQGFQSTMELYVFASQEIQEKVLPQFTGTDQIIVNENIAKSYKVKIGDKVSVFGRDFEVIDIDEEAGYFTIPYDSVKGKTGEIFKQIRERHIFPNPLSKTQIAELNDLGLRVIPDDDGWALVPTLAIVGLFLISLAFAVACTNSVCKNMDGGVSVARLLGAKRWGFIFAQVGTAVAVFVVAIIIAVLLNLVFLRLDSYYFTETNVLLLPDYFILCSIDILSYSICLFIARVFSQRSIKRGVQNVE